MQVQRTDLRDVHPLAICAYGALALSNNLSIHRRFRLTGEHVVVLTIFQVIIRNPEGLALVRRRTERPKEKRRPFRKKLGNDVRCRIIYQTSSGYLCVLGVQPSSFVRRMLAIRLPY